MGASTPPTIIMTSIRQQVFEYLTNRPKTSLKKLINEFCEYKKSTVTRYLTQFRELKIVDIQVDIDIKNELKKIITDYTQPASARVQAIREYNNLLETQPEDKSSDDGFLKWLETQGKLTSTNPSITDTSSITSTSLTPEKDGNTRIKT